MFEKFLKRPVLAIVLSIVIVFMGVMAMETLPTAQFPDIAPPVVVVNIAFPGSSAKVLENSVLIPIEKAINGVPNMKYMTSDATSAGEATIQVYFNLGTDPNLNMVNVKTRIEQVTNRLPDLVQREGLIVSYTSPNMLMYVNLYSKDPHANQQFLYNFANVNIIPQISRLNGVGSAKILGSRIYAMRIWLDPDRMRAYNVSTDEIMKAMSQQSIIGTPGRLGQSTGQRSQSIEYTLTYQERYNKPEQYENIILRANANGEILKLKDVAKVDLGSEFYDVYSNMDGHPSASITLKQNYGSNASDVIKEVKAQLEEIKKSSFPPGMDYQISYDVSNFLHASIHKVVHTLIEAFILVAFVVFIFLGDWRSTLIPIIAVPVSLVGAFIFLQLMGMSLNMITLFALVLAIGVVVDDAIVVVEATHAKMEEKHLSPYKAVIEVVKEISGAVIAITLLMTAVFVPIAFMSGPVGVFFRQFAITMAASIVISGFVALTLTPVLCAMILKNNHGAPKKKTPVTWFIDRFNLVFERLTGRYTNFLKRVVNRRWVTFGVLIAFAVGIMGVTKVLPSGFIPNEDQGMIYAIIQTPPGSTLEKTNDISRELQEVAEKVEGVSSVTALAGYEILTEGRGSNAGTCLIQLKDWEERKENVNQIIDELKEKTKDIPANIEFFGPPAVPGYGTAGGFSMRLLDKTNTGDYKALGEVNDEFMAALKKRKELAGLFTFFTDNYPQYELTIDNQAAMQKGVSIQDAMDNLGILVGSTYELGFVRFTTFFKVYVQALPQYRALPDDIMKLYVKNDRGEEVPYSSFMKMTKTHGMNEITRYNMYPSAAIKGEPAAGYSTGEAVKVINEVAAQVLPRGYGIAWEGITFDEAARGNEAVYIFLVVLVFVYLVLAAQYESFIIPLSVILSLPMGIFGAFFLVKMFGLSNDVYTQVGLVMLVGLLGKNAVLIVEFAMHKHAEGMTIFQAAVEGAKVRFRPILMTSFAFVAGMIPLLFSTGPGAISNRTIGAAAAGGMFIGTLFGVIIIPGLYFIFGTIASKRKMLKDEDENPLLEEIEHND